MPSSRPTKLPGLFSYRDANCQPIIKHATLICRNLILIVLTVLCPWNCSVAEELSERELQIKVAYLYHFTKFIEWPSASPVFHYCVYEDADFTNLLQKSYSNKTIGEASIEVKNVSAKTKLDDCQVIYFPHAVSADLLEKISKFPILSIGTQQDFTELGGIIYLFEDDQKLSFFVKNTLATNVGLKINSQLLKLSKEP